MFKCNVCEGINFSFESGFYYCLDCHTRIREWRVEEADFISPQVAEQQSNLSKGLTKEMLSRIEGMLTVAPTWVIMNKILAKQVNQMQLMPGVNPGFRFIVLSVWAKYLKVKGCAFLSDRSVPHVNTASCFRDYCALTSAKYFYKSYRSRHKKARSVISRLSALSADSSLQSRSFLRGKLRKELATQQYMEGQSDTASVYNTDASHATSTCSFKEYSNISSCPKNIRASNDKIWDRKHLIAILYLGLVFTKSEAQLSDLLRWIREGRVSYLHIYDLLPLNIDMTSDESHIFRTYFHEPTLIVAAKETMNMCRLVSIHDIPTPDLQSLAMRYTRELNLPAILDEYLVQLFLHFTVDNTICPESDKPVYIIDTRAMAYVIVMLKMIYGLDDLTEYQMSTDAQTMNATLSSKHVFSWTEWIEFIEARKCVFSFFFPWAKNKFNQNAHYNQYQDNQDYFTQSWKANQMMDIFARSNISIFLENIQHATSSDYSVHHCKPINLHPSLNLLTTAWTAVQDHARDAGLTLPPQFSYNFISCIPYSTYEPAGRNNIRNKILREPSYQNSQTRPAIYVAQRIKEKKRRVTVADKIIQQLPTYFQIDMNDVFENCNINFNRLYWVYHLDLENYNSEQFTCVMTQLPNSFVSLLIECTSVINDAPYNVYKEVCVLEKNILASNLFDNYLKDNY